jgi:SET domain-containing protein
MLPLFSTSPWCQGTTTTTLTTTATARPPAQLRPGRSKSKRRERDKERERKRVGTGPSKNQIRKKKCATLAIMSRFRMENPIYLKMEGLHI